jgi:hypothetical protein
MKQSEKRAGKKTGKNREHEPVFLPIRQSRQLKAQETRSVCSPFRWTCRHCPTAPSDALVPGTHSPRLAQRVGVGPALALMLSFGPQVLLALSFGPYALSLVPDVAV